MVSKVQDSKTKKANDAILPVLLCAIAIPLSMLFWIGNLAYSFFRTDDISGRQPDEVVIPPTRWLASTIIPLAITMWGLRKKSLDKTGAVLGLFIGFILTLTSYTFLACLFTFFLSSSKATKFRAHKKRKLEEDFKEGGQRNWIQVLCNGGMATQLALLYLLDSGCGERPVDFHKDYRSSWLSLGILGAFACCNGDTWASELGTVVGSAEPFLITNRQRVPRGTNGGVTLHGLLFSLLGGLVIGAANYFALILCIDKSILESSPPQWPLVIAGGFGGLIGSIVDSFLGATLQYSGIDEQTGVVVERAGKGIKHICGKQVLDNHSVNLLSSIIMGVVTPKLAMLLWL